VFTIDDTGWDNLPESMDNDMTGQHPPVSLPLESLMDNTSAISDAQFRLVAEHMEAILCLLRDSQMVFANRQLEKITGYTQAEVSAMSVYDLLLPEDAGRVRAAVTENRQLSPRPAMRLEFRIQRKNGGICWIDLTVKHIVLDGMLTSLCIAHDMTASKQISDALRQSEDRYRSVVDKQLELVSRCTPDTVLTFANESYCRYFGVKREDIIGKSFMELVVDSDREATLSHLQRVAQNGVPFLYEHRVVLPSGEVRWQEWTDYPIIAQDGTVSEFQSVGRDITERKQAEAERNHYIHWLEIIQRVDSELTQVLSFDYVLKIALDAAIRLSRASAGAIHMVEKEQMWVAHIIGNYPGSMIGMRVPTSKGIIGRVVRSGKAEFITDVRNDPDYVPNVVDTVSQITVPLVAADRLLGVMNVQSNQRDYFTPQIFDLVKLLASRVASALDNARLYDVSQQQLGELQGLYQQVSLLEQLKTQVIRVAAHDLRNPLGVISGYVQLLEVELEDKIEPRLKDYFGIIRQATDRIDKITRDILTMERMGEAQELLMEHADLREIVLEVCDSLRPQARDKGIDLRVTVTDTPVIVVGNRTLLHETADNLLNNAIKYTPTGGQITVTLRLEEKQVIFEVQDSGFGIPQDQQDRLFQPFFRAQTKETRSIKGTGLGLHIVKSIIERHHGTLRFKSTYGAGSTFGFALPLMKKSSSKARKITTVFPKLS
jgi:PAS domain S-box-containing protein